MKQALHKPIVTCMMLRQQEESCKLTWSSDMSWSASIARQRPFWLFWPEVPARTSTLRTCSAKKGQALERHIWLQMAAVQQFYQP